MSERFFFNYSTPKKSDYTRRYQPYSTPRRTVQDEDLSGSFQKNLTFTTPRKHQERFKHSRQRGFRSNNSTPRSSRSLMSIKTESDESMHYYSPIPSRSWMNTNSNDYSPIIPTPGYILSPEQVQRQQQYPMHTPGYVLLPEQLQSPLFNQEYNFTPSGFFQPSEQFQFPYIKQECPSPLPDLISSLVPTSKSSFPPLIPSLRGPFPLLQPSKPLPNIEQFYQRVPCRTDFTKLGMAPHFKLVLSNRSVLKLADPMNCVYNEANDHWIIADRQKGIVVVNRDCSMIVQTYTSSYIRKPSAVILVNDGSQAAVLDDFGIHILDFRKGTFEQIYRRRHCRGLGMTLIGDFVTFDTFNYETLIIPQDTLKPIVIPYEAKHKQNDENQSSRVSYIGVTDRRICLVDYTLGVITVYKYDPYKREVIEDAVADCAKHVAQCRLSGCFLDCEGRILVANCKEQKLMHFDHNASFLKFIDVQESFCRSAGLYVNSSFQTLVVDTWTQEVRFGKLCDMSN